METCNIHKMLKVLGKKWTFPILSSLKRVKTARFNTLEFALKDRITPRALALALKELEQYKIITKAQNYYSLTINGENILDLTKSMKAFCHANNISLPDNCDLNCIECEYYR